MSSTTSLKIKFKGGSGVLLDGRLELPAHRPQAYAIFSHCFTCTKETLATFRISRLLAEKGFAVLRFDFTGLGNSEGDFADTNFTTMVDDILAAAAYLNINHVAPAFLLGHSMGGTAALAAAAQLQNIKGIVTIASPSRPDHVLHHFGEALVKLENNEDSLFQIAGQSYPIKPQFIHDVRAFDPMTVFALLNQPVLIFRALTDDIVAGANAEQIQNWVSGSSEIVTLDNADHLFSNRQDSEIVADRIHAWASEL